MPEAAEEPALGRVRQRHRIGQVARAAEAARGTRAPLRRGRGERGELPEKRRRTLAEIGVEALVHEHRAVLGLHESSRKDFLDSGRDEVTWRRRACGPGRLPSVLGRRNLHTRAFGTRLLPEEIADPLAHRLGDHAPSILRTSAAVAALLGMGQPPFRS